MARSQLRSLQWSPWTPRRLLVSPTPRQRAERVEPVQHTGPHGGANPLMGRRASPSNRRMAEAALRSGRESARRKVECLGFSLAERQPWVAGRIKPGKAAWQAGARVALQSPLCLHCYHGFFRSLGQFLQDRAGLRRGDAFQHSHSPISLQKFPFENRPAEGAYRRSSLETVISSCP
jgi:hypothetical protein